jgi:hypothetical protein
MSRATCEACRQRPADYVLYIGGPHDNPGIARAVAQGTATREARCGACIPLEAVRVSGFAYRVDAAPGRAT